MGKRSSKFTKKSYVRNSKIKFLFLPLLTIIFALLALIIIKNTEERKIPLVGNTSCYREILDSIDRTKPSFTKKKIVYDELTKNEKQDFPEGLKSFLIQSIYENDIDGHSEKICPREGAMEEDFVFESQAADLNNDGISEYIVTLWDLCNRGLRGASGNGDIWVIKKKSDSWERIATLSGNCYVITNDKTNGFFTILTNWADAANSGTVTLYAWGKDDKGTETYGESQTQEYEYDQ